MISHLAVVLTTVVVLFGPGALLAVGLGLGRWAVLAGAPVLTFGIVVAYATVSSFVALPWNGWALLASTVATTVAAFAVRAVARRRSPDPTSSLLDRRALLARPALSTLVVVIGVVLGWILSASTLWRGFGTLDTPNQDWDYVFHSNAVRLIADSQSAAPATLRLINDWEVQSSFYPNAFHALGAVVRDVTGAPVFTVLNSLTLMITGVAGLGLAALLRRIGAPTFVCAATPVLLAGFASFPYDTIWRGPLLPFSTGLALIPAFFLLLRGALDRRRFPEALATGLAAAALLGVQTATALSAALIAVPFLAHRWITRRREFFRDLVPLVVTGASGVLLAVPFVSGVLSMNSTGPRVDWPAVMSTGQAVGDLLLLNHGAAAPQYWLAGALLVGLFTLRRADYLWWWAAGGAVSLVLFVLSAALDTPAVEDLTAPWWNDRWRFAASAVLALAPLAAHGLYTIAQAVTPTLTAAARRLGGARPAPERFRALLSGRRVPAVATLGLAALFVLSNGLYAPSNTARVASAYQNPGQLDQREVDAMRWLSEQPDSDGWIMNDPLDGSPYMSALFGLDPVFRHILSPGSAAGETQRLLLDHFNCLDSDQDVRDAIDDLDITYVFVSSGYVRSFWGRDVGLTGLGESPSLELVHSAPGLQIYRVALTPELASTPIPACSVPQER